MTNSMIKYETTFEATENLPRLIGIGHGENADLYTSITDCGVAVSLSGYTVSALYQPCSQWGTEVWYSCPFSVADNEVIVHWSHLQDGGDNRVNLWVSFSKDGQLSYPALYKIGLFKTPGFTPSPIRPIPETIDFSQYNLVNAPWVLPEDLSAYATTSSLSAYAQLSSLEEINDEISSLNESVMGLDISKADAETLENLANSLSAYATKVENATNGNFAGLDTNGNLVDSGKKPSDFLSSQTQVNWNESDSSSAAYIQNKPTIPAPQVNSDWNALSGVAAILNKPTIPDVSGKEDKSNKVTSLNAQSTNAQYPSAKCVYDLIGDVETLINAI